MASYDIFFVLRTSTWNGAYSLEGWLHRYSVCIEAPPNRTAIIMLDRQPRMRNGAELNVCATSIRFTAAAGPKKQKRSVRSFVPTERAGGREDGGAGGVRERASEQSCKVVSGAEERNDGRTNGVDDGRADGRASARLAIEGRASRSGPSLCSAGRPTSLSSENGGGSPTRPQRALARPPDYRGYDRRRRRRRNRHRYPFPLSSCSCTTYNSCTSTKLRTAGGTVVRFVRCRLLYDGGGGGGDLSEPSPSLAPSLQPPAVCRLLFHRWSLWHGTPSTSVIVLSHQTWSAGRKFSRQIRVFKFICCERTIERADDVP